MSAKRFTGKTESDAVMNAAMELGIPSTDLKYTVIDSGSNGFLGLFKKPVIIEIKEEEKKETVMECFPDSEMAEEYRKLAEAIYELSKRPEGSACEKADEKYTADKRPGEGLKC